MAIPPYKHHRRWSLNHLIVAALLLVVTAVASNSQAIRPVRQTSPYDDSNSLLEYSEQRLLGSAQRFGPTTSNVDPVYERNGTDNRKPTFRDCASYAPSVREEQPPDKYVIKVQAYDPDGDKLVYSFVNAISERPKFRITPDTGEIRTAYMFDRDEPAREKEVSFRFDLENRFLDSPKS